MRFDGPFGSISLNPAPRPALWTHNLPREDPLIAAIKALVDSAPHYAHGGPKTPEAAILASIRALLEENR